MSNEGSLAPIEILSTDEEFALSMLRDVLDHVRSNGSVVATGLLEQAIADAGGHADCWVAGNYGRIFRVKGARFAIQPGANSQGTIEVIFIEGEL
jgi:hypothetical protein